MKNYIRRIGLSVLILTLGTACTALETIASYNGQEFSPVSGHCSSALQIKVIRDSKEQIKQIVLSPYFVVQVGDAGAVSVHKMRQPGSSQRITLGPVLGFLERYEERYYLDGQKIRKGVRYYDGKTMKRGPWREAGRISFDPKIIAIQMGDVDCIFERVGQD